MYVGHLGTIHVKRGNGYTTRNIIPVAHYIFINLAHGEGTALNKDQPGSETLLFCLCNLVATHVFIVVVPTGSFRFVVFLFPEEPAIFT